MNDNINNESLKEAGRKVIESYDDGFMPTGDEVLVVFNDCSIIYKMEEDRHLKISVNMDKPIVLDMDLFE